MIRAAMPGLLEYVGAAVTADRAGLAGAPVRPLGGGAARSSSPTAGRWWSRTARASPRRPPGCAGSPVPGGPPVPEVLGEDGGWSLDTCRRAADARPPPRSSAGGSPRCTRRARDAFGSPPPGGPADALIGRAPMRNVPAPSWARVVRRATGCCPTSATARDAGDLDRGRGRRASSGVRGCRSWPAPAEPPARLHGDLWSGNVLWAPDGAWLIDPAAHGGHRETDLAMLALFGCPHLDVVLAAYDEAAPLADGWRGARADCTSCSRCSCTWCCSAGATPAQALAAARAVPG